MDTLKGHIERVTFSSDETAFCVCRLKVAGQRDLVTIVGNMVNPQAGECVELSGEWTAHPKFGNQFQVRQYKTVVPATQAGIRKYLGSGLVRGIGPVMADRIVKVFGLNSLDIIEKDIQKLRQVPGIGKKRIGMIKEAWEEQKEVRAVMVFLQSHGISPAYAAKIFKVYGQEAISKVLENPYALARDIYGIGFLTADRIAESIGIEKENPKRIEAGIEFFLSQMAEKGHVCYPYSQLCEQVKEMLDVQLDLVRRSVDQGVRQNYLVIDSLDENTGLNSSEHQVYLKQFHICETSIAVKLNLLKAHSRSARDIDAHKAFEWVQSQIKLKFASEQKEAIQKALTQKIMVITGGPGTGKTTIINAIIKIYKAAKMRVLLAAPTGRAAKRMSEATWENARTIHRMLDYSMQSFGFKKNDKNPLKCDVLIIDEASMIDTVLMHHLLKAVPKGAVLILVGDVNQLPSVGPGNVLSDIITSERFCVVRLETIFRQARQSLIVVNAHRINNGDFPIMPKEDKKSNFYFIQKEDPEDILQTILDLVSHRIPDRFNHDPVNDIQVLTPMHRGLIGAGNLNLELQKKLNRSKTVLSRGNREFKVGDKVMQIRNNYDKHTYNGDIGKILSIDFDAQTTVIDFDSRQVEYGFSSLDEIVHAYAVSIHKSQGSEYPAVVIPVATQHYVLLQRNLIYTAITRGKKLVVLVGTKKALAMAIRTVKSQERHTCLSERIKKRSNPEEPDSNANAANKRPDGLLFS